MAHDLNNILQPISMAMGVVRSRISDSVSRGMLDMVAANTRRATSLVSQVLAFGRGMEGNHAPIVARSFVGEIVRMIQKTFPKNIEIRERSGENETRLSGDVTQLSQVMLNLCLNARDAMP
ncbi:MAG: hybrid sensor histidine kinase/response regulator, partial [Verrucomicrobiota bacterium]